MNENPLDHLLKQWLAVDEQASTATAVKQVEVLAAQARLEQLRAELISLLAPFQAEKIALVAEAEPYVLHLRKAVKSSDGRAMFVFRKGTRSWDLDGLDSLRSSLPDVWETIKPYRRQEPDTVYVRKGKVE